MTTTRDRALAAAVHLVGGSGVRALTHARVDAEAGLPRGSTSNHFRTRAALVSGVITWIAESERADLVGMMTPAESIDDVIDAYCAIVRDLTGRNAERTRARYALFFEMTADPDVQRRMRTERTTFEAWTRALLTGLGAKDPDAATRAFMVFGTGLIVTRLTVDPDAPLRSIVATAVRACLESSPRDGSPLAAPDSRESGV